MTRRSLLLLAPTILLSAPGAPLAAQEYPTSPPPAGPIRPNVFPPFQEERLPNGLTLLLVENHRQPVVSISLAIPAGTVFDPTGKEGTAALVAGLLTKGAGGRSAEQIAEAIERVGGSIGAGAENETLTLRADVLAPDATLAFELLGAAVTAPDFPADELELLRTQTLSSLQLELSQPASIAQRQFNRVLYGDHPFARASTSTSVQAIARDDLVAFHRDRVRPEGSLLVITGALRLEEVRRLAGDAFGTWNGSPAAVAAFPAPPTRSAREILLVHRPGSVQSNILIGNLTFPPTDTASYAATIANQVLGGGAGSRLFMILREEKGWTYGAYSSVVRRQSMGAFLANAEVRTEVTDSALGEMLHQGNRIRTEPVNSEELAAAKGALVGRFPLSIETADQVAGAVLNARLLGLPPDYLSTYRTRLAAVDAASLQRAATRLITPDASLVVIVGDATRMLETVERYGPIRMLTPTGESLSREALFGPATRLPVDLSLMAARSDSFAIMIQGMPLGGQRITLERTDAGFRYHEKMSIAGVVNQQIDVAIDAAGRATVVTQAGQVQGQPTAVNVLYVNGRATGDATTLDPASGVKTVTVDTTVSEAAIDDNTILAFLPTLPWATGARWTFPVFNAGQGSEVTLTLSVTGTESVTVPAGTHDAFRADLTGGPSPFTFWVSVAEPHRVLKVALVGQPIEFVLVP